MKNEDLPASKRGIRLIALAVGILGIWDLLSNLVLSWTAFDPSYLQDYIAHNLARPGIALLLAVVLWISAARLGRWMET